MWRRRLHLRCLLWRWSCRPHRWRHVRGLRWHRQGWSRGRTDRRWQCLEGHWRCWWRSRRLLCRRRCGGARRRGRLEDIVRLCHEDLRSSVFRELAAKRDHDDPSGRTPNPSNDGRHPDLHPPDDRRNKEADYEQHQDAPPRRVVEVQRRALAHRETDLEGIVDRRSARGLRLRRDGCGSQRCSAPDSSGGHGVWRGAHTCA